MLNLSKVMSTGSLLCGWNNTTVAFRPLGDNINPGSFLLLSAGRMEPDSRCPDNTMLALLLALYIIINKIRPTAHRYPPVTVTSWKISLVPRLLPLDIIKQIFLQSWSYQLIALYSIFNKF